MNEPLNPYERYEITGMSPEEEIQGQSKRNDEYWDNYPEEE